MRRFQVIVSLLAVLAAAVAGGTRLGSDAVAQEGTPAAEEGIPEGVSFAGLAYIVAEELPPAPAEMALFRIGLEPGAAFPLDPGDPSVALAYVETGSVTFAVDTPIKVLRAAGAGTPFPVEQEEVAAGVEFTLAAGDSALFPPRTEGEARNEGSGSASVLVANVWPTGEGEAGATGTPAP